MRFYQIIEIQNMNARKGFSLVEVLLAIALITLVIAGVGSGFQYAASMGAYAQNKIVAANDAEKTMEEVRRVSNLSAGLSGVIDSNYWTTWVAGQTFSGLPNETVSVSFPAGTGQDPLQVLVTVSWSEKSATRTFQLYNLVTKRS